MFKNILKIAAFFPFENFLTHGAINQDLRYAKIGVFKRINIIIIPAQFRLIIKILVKSKTNQLKRFFHSLSLFNWNISEKLKLKNMKILLNLELELEKNQIKK